jgi:hypothetical protein
MVGLLPSYMLLWRDTCLTLSWIAWEYVIYFKKNVTKFECLRAETIVWIVKAVLQGWNFPCQDAIIFSCSRTSELVTLFSAYTMKQYHVLWHATVCRNLNWNCWLAVVLGQFIWGFSCLPSCKHFQSLCFALSVEYWLNTPLIIVLSYRMIFWICICISFYAVVCV